MNASGYTALHCAILKRNKTIVEMLLSAGADPNVGTQATGETALHLAIKGSKDSESMALVLVVA